jgi:hypothetical protein
MFRHAVSFAGTALRLVRPTIPDRLDKETS